MNGPYLVGESKRVYVLCEDVDGEQSDPSTLIFTADKPDGTQIVYELGEDAEVVQATGDVEFLDAEGNVTAIYDADDGGIYYVELAFVEGDEGVWQWRWESTGQPAQAAEGAFRVTASRIAAAEA